MTYPQSICQDEIKSPHEEITSLRAAAALQTQDLIFRNHQAGQKAGAFGPTVNRNRLRVIYILGLADKSFKITMILFL